MASPNDHSHSYLTYQASNLGVMYVRSLRRSLTSAGFFVDSTDCDDTKLELVQSFHLIARYDARRMIVINDFFDLGRTLRHEGATASELRHGVDLNPRSSSAPTD